METLQEKATAAASYEDGMDSEIVDLANAVGKAAAASSVYLPGAAAAAAEDSDSTFGPPGKRRKSNSRDNNNDDDDDDDLKPAAKPSSSRRARSSSRKKRATPKAAAVNDEDDEGEYLDNNRRHKKAKQSGNSTVANRTCPFCSKLISSKAGLKYHVGKIRHLIFYQDSHLILVEGAFLTHLIFLCTQITLFADPRLVPI